MLLRRITQHVHKQNWFAVFIDFIIVVFGVFIGIQVANWNERLNESLRAENYRNRLLLEMNINKDALIGRQHSFAKQVDYGLFALKAPTEPVSSEMAWPIVRAFFQASHAFSISLQRGTYDEIINSGDLALLNNQELVNALTEFYSFSGFSTIDTIPDYRENVRRIIPFQLQKYFQSNCYEVAMPDMHYLLDCQAPDGLNNLTALAAELQANSELKKDLRYMISFADVSASIAQDLNLRVEGMLHMLSQQTPPKES